MSLKRQKRPTNENEHTIALKHLRPRILGKWQNEKTGRLLHEARPVSVNSNAGKHFELRSRFTHQRDHFVDQLVFASLLASHEVVSVGVFFDFLEAGTGVLDHDLVQLKLDGFQMRRVDQDLFGGTLHSSQRLMNHDAGVGQGVTFAGSTSSQQQGTHRSGLTNTVSGHVTINELHRVVDGQARRDASAW